MLFEKLIEAENKKELILVDGGICVYHVRRDKQLTIHVILSQKKGVGYQMLKKLESISDITSIFAKCPSDLPAVDWYKRNGFVEECVQTLKSGRSLIYFRKPIHESLVDESDVVITD